MPVAHLQAGCFAVQIRSRRICRQHKRGFFGVAVGWVESNENQQSIRECYVGLHKLSTNLPTVFNPVYCRQKLALFYG